MISSLWKMPDTPKTALGWNISGMAISVVYFSLVTFLLLDWVQKYLPKAPYAKPNTVAKT